MSHCIILDGGYHGEKQYDSEYRSCHENCRQDGSFPFKKELRGLLEMIGKRLEAKGLQVYYTRCGDTCMTPSKAAELANAILRGANPDACALLSFHRSLLACPGRRANAEIFVYERGSSSSRLAHCVLEKLQETGFNSLGVQERPNLTILRRANMPALFISLGNLPFSADTPERNREFLEKTADAFVTGILNAFM